MIGTAFFRGAYIRTLLRGGFAGCMRGLQFARSVVSRSHVDAVVLFALCPLFFPRSYAERTVFPR